MKRLITWRNTELEPKTKKNKSEIISIRLTPETKEALAQYAIQDDRTFSSLISKIVGDWLRKQNKQDSWRWTEEIKLRTKAKTKDVQ
jgi:prolyl oligopeptidase PreP (S9A serine peptidase family)